MRKVFATNMASAVYDLSVEGRPEFVASGILVHNCIDAARYGMDGLIHRRGKDHMWEKLAGKR